ncbi:unnamed protein product [Amoebophrya sp. A25]|nr:unnamed protein product [Amoebophrya sp. A25]|eukprot:GSA25T00026683001.1
MGVPRFSRGQRQVTATLTRNLHTDVVVVVTPTDGSAPRTSANMVGDMSILPPPILPPPATPLPRSGVTLSAAGATPSSSSSSSFLVPGGPGPPGGLNTGGPSGGGGPHMNSSSSTFATFLNSGAGGAIPSSKTTIGSGTGGRGTQDFRDPDLRDKQVNSQKLSGFCLSPPLRGHHGSHYNSHLSRRGRRAGSIATPRLAPGSSSKVRRRSTSRGRASSSGAGAAPSPRWFGGAAMGYPAGYESGQMAILPGSSTPSVGSATFLKMANTPRSRSGSASSVVSAGGPGFSSIAGSANMNATGIGTVTVDSSGTGNSTTPSISMTMMNFTSSSSTSFNNAASTSAIGGAGSAFAPSTAGGSASSMLLLGNNPGTATQGIMPSGASQSLSHSQQLENNSQSAPICASSLNNSVLVASQASPRTSSSTLQIGEGTGLGGAAGGPSGGIFGGGSSSSSQSMNISSSPFGNTSFATASSIPVVPCSSPGLFGTSSSSLGIMDNAFGGSVPLFAASSEGSTMQLEESWATNILLHSEEPSSGDVVQQQDAVDEEEEGSSSPDGHEPGTTSRGRANLLMSTILEDEQLPPEEELNAHGVGIDAHKRSRKSQSYSGANLGLDEGVGVGGIGGLGTSSNSSSTSSGIGGGGVPLSLGLVSSSSMSSSSLPPPASRMGAGFLSPAAGIQMSTTTGTSSSALVGIHQPPPSSGTSSITTSMNMGPLLRACSTTSRSGDHAASTSSFHRPSAAFPQQGLSSSSNIASSAQIGMAGALSSHIGSSSSDALGAMNNANNVLTGHLGPTTGTTSTGVLSSLSGSSGIQHPNLGFAGGSTSTTTSSNNCTPYSTSGQSHHLSLFPGKGMLSRMISPPLCPQKSPPGGSMMNSGSFAPLNGGDGLGPTPLGTTNLNTPMNNNNNNSTGTGLLAENLNVQMSDDRSLSSNAGAANTPGTTSDQDIEFSLRSLSGERLFDKGEAPVSQPVAGEGHGHGLQPQTGTASASSSGVIQQREVCSLASFAGKALPNKRTTGSRESSSVDNADTSDNNDASTSAIATFLCRKRMQSGSERDVLSDSVVANFPTDDDESERSWAPVRKRQRRNALRPGDDDDAIARTFYNDADSVYSDLASLPDSNFGGGGAIPNPNAATTSSSTSVQQGTTGTATSSGQQQPPLAPGATVGATSSSSSAPGGMLASPLLEQSPNSAD